MLYTCFFKYFFDFILVVILLPFLLLSTMFVWVLIFFDDRGPLFYVAQRNGQHGKMFLMFKFRTMILNAPDIRTEDGSTYNSADDSRVTRVGKFLRKTSIDEFPQFINILLGQMSFIGPRPDPIDWMDKYSKEELGFLVVKPGITGYNQAYFRNSADSALKLKNDLYYANHISFSLDLRILIRTIKTILLRENLFVDETRKVKEHERNR